MWIHLLLIATVLYTAHASTCVCTTIICPVEGRNDIIMGNGYARMEYTYQLHGDHEVVVSASGTIELGSLDNGTGTTSCTQEYSRMLEDDGSENCDAGHILANRLGGYGNEPLNLFPQIASVNRGIYAQFEGDIYDCMQSGARSGLLSWEFNYETPERTMPTTVNYSATFDGGNCTTMSSLFPN